MPRTMPIPEVRDLRFDLSSVPRHWHGGRRAVTTFLDNLSLFFPPGESFFVKSVRAFRHAVTDPRLQKEVDAFCAQEGHHTREHRQYNRMLERQGYRAVELERRVQDLLDRVTRLTPKRWQLAATCALEHFTAVMGHLLLNEPRLLEDCDPHMAALWLWHAAEEYEHKAVAFEVFQAAGGTWAERSIVMLGATAIFWVKVLEHQVILMRDDGTAGSAREWLDLVRFLAWKPGVLHHVARHYLEYFRPGFHPHDLEGLAPLSSWKERFERDAVYAASRRPKAEAGGAQVTADGLDDEVAIVGAGFSGLGMAIALKRRGEERFSVLEKADRVGGTWRENTYPGCACDVPSSLYCYSFEPNPAWGRRFAEQPEILAYLEGCVERYGIAPHLRLGARLESARYDEALGAWRLRTGDGGTRTARFLALGLGPLHRPSLPPIEGRERFRGRAFHSAAWPDEPDLAGRRVAVIGTGASAIQLIPRIAPEVQRLMVFQRTPPWVLPKVDWPKSGLERRLIRALPFLGRLERYATYWSLETRALGFTLEPRLLKAAEVLGRWHLRRQVRDPAIRAGLLPDYRAGCKRLLMANDYYPVFERPNVGLVTEGIERFDEAGIVTADGRHHAVDVVIYATGFRVTEPAPAGLIEGPGGADLAAMWDRDGVEAYLGTAVHGFPNLFLLMGPNTGLGHTSMVFMVEAQIGYALQVMEAVRRRGARAFDVRADVQRAYNDGLARRLRRTVWASGCRSWYLDARGRNPTLWPGFTFEFWARTLRLAERDLQLVG